jgi:hypothetical protein|tara:strand:- start:709 stop:1245 length:537 start_codon:yes stop_codon:yes gene_type:complete
MRLISLFMAVVLVGCSPVEVISENAHGIRGSADTSIAHLETIKEIGSAEVSIEADAVISEQENIIVLAEGIKQQLPNVRNAVPWWASMIDRIVIVGGILGVAFLCWHLGIGYITKRLFWSIGWFIPKRAMRSAELDIKVERNGITSREAVAARRGDDMAYEAARKKVKKGHGYDLSKH